MYRAWYRTWFSIDHGFFRKTKSKHTKQKFVMQI